MVAGIAPFASKRARLALRGRPWAAPAIWMDCRDVSGELPDAFWVRFAGSLGVYWTFVREHLCTRKIFCKIEIEKRI